MIDAEILSATDEWLKNLKNMLPNVSSENMEYIQNRITLIERLREQVARVKELEKEIEAWRKLKEATVNLKKENKRYKQALQFYANENNWVGSITSIGVFESAVEQDQGKKARQALECSD